MSDFNSNDEQPTEVVVQQIKKIAESGNVDIQWNDLKNALTTRLENIITNYTERQETKLDKKFDEPNVEKFSLEDSRDEIFNLIASFTEPPFTIQRICELLYSPFKYYDRISTFLRGLEKNLRVISSNDWPKCPAPVIINHKDSSLEESTTSGELSYNSIKRQQGWDANLLDRITETIIDSDICNSSPRVDTPESSRPHTSSSSPSASSSTSSSASTTEQPLKETSKQSTPPPAQQEQQQTQQPQELQEPQEPQEPQQPSSPPPPSEPESVKDG